ncbi:2-hydroxy-6-oxonona-2,4-dienedioate hydrolase [Rossellomorea marisflavi]
MKYYVEVVGSGPSPLIFLPGTGWGGNVGQPIADVLSKSYTVHMIDLPGIGRGDGLSGMITMEDAAGWVKEYMDEQGWESATIIGHSLGGAIGLSAASLHPDRVDKLVLLDIGFARIDRFPVAMFGKTGYFLPVISGLHRLFGPRFLGQDGEKEPSPNIKTEEEMVSLISSLELNDDASIREAILAMQEPTPSGIGLLLALYRYHMPKALKELSTPTLVLYGNREGKSPRIQRKIVRQVSKYKKHQHTFKALVGGHYAHMSDDRSFSYIRDFLHSSDPSIIKECPE